MENQYWLPPAEETGGPDHDEDEPGQQDQHIQRYPRDSRTAQRNPHLRIAVKDDDLEKIGGRMRANVEAEPHANQAVRFIDAG